MWLLATSATASAVGTNLMNIGVMCAIEVASTVRREHASSGALYADLGREVVTEDACFIEAGEGETVGLERNKPIHTSYSLVSTDSTQRRNTVGNNFYLNPFQLQDAISSTSRPKHTKVKMPSLMRLPLELHLQIIEYLEFFPTTMLMQITSRYFYNLIPALSDEEMGSLEHEDRCFNHDLRSCNDCHRLRPGHNFVPYDSEIFGE
ncbi:MAG: hypothetical protein Q9175_002414 [Cornicularia normoerica]